MFWKSKLITGCLGGSLVKNPLASAGDMDLTFRLGSSREGNGNPLLYSCLGNPMDRGTWQAVVQEVAKSWTLLSDLTTTKAYYY